MAATLYPRHLMPIVSEALADTPVVCLLGARQVGKTTLAQRLKPKRAYISLDNRDTLAAAQTDPIGFIEGLPRPVILDEVQRAPEILPAIKLAVDRQRSPGQFLLTGSANLLLLPAVQESLAGRMEVIRLQPLSELEKQRHKQSLLQALINGTLKTQIAAERKSVQTLAGAICSGGYPEPLQRGGKRARQWYREYLQTIVQRDVKDVADIRDQDELLRLVELLAYRTASLLNASSLANELNVGRKTVEKYISVLERLFLIRRLPAWHRNQAKRLVKTPKVHVVDSGLAATLNGLSAADWTSHADDFGHLLESFVVQQLICQAGWVNRDLRFYHYRDKDQVEVDLVIEQGRNIWGVEVKRAASVQAKDAIGLKRLAWQAGKHFQGGMVLYTGASCLPLTIENSDAKCFAVPISRIWGK